MTVTRRSLNSSAIAEVAYDGEAEVLELKYTNGTTYAYSGVPAEVFEELLASSSAGSFVSAHIRNKFTTTKAMF